MSHSSRGVGRLVARGGREVVRTLESAQQLLDGLFDAVQLARRAAAAARARRARRASHSQQGVCAHPVGLSADDGEGDVAEGGGDARIAEREGV